MLANLKIYELNGCMLVAITTLKKNYLDLTDSFMSLGHTDTLGWVFIRQNLSAAKVVSSKDDPINKVFWLTGTWDCVTKRPL